MENLSQIGLSKDNSQNISELLNGLLSDYQIYYQNLRGLHWLVKGEQFFGLHELYEKLYDEAAETIDEIAERILTLGNIPLHTFSDYLKNASLTPISNISNGKEGVIAVKNDMSILLGKFRRIFQEASQISDEGTVALLGDLISKFEKTLWMLNAFLA